MVCRSDSSPFTDIDVHGGSLKHERLSSWGGEHVRNTPHLMAAIVRGWRIFPDLTRSPLDRIQDVAFFGSGSTRPISEVRTLKPFQTSRRGCGRFARNGIGSCNEGRPGWGNWTLRFLQRGLEWALAALTYVRPIHVGCAEIDWSVVGEPASLFRSDIGVIRDVAGKIYRRSRTGDGCFFNGQPQSKRFWAGVRVHASVRLE